MSSPERRRVVIVGAGIAGLTLAAALDATRFDVALHEAQPERMTGAALGLWSDARDAVERLGVDLAWRGERRVELGSLTGGRALTMPAPDVAQVRRPALMAALTQALPDTVERVTGAVSDPRALADETGAHLVVGADGVRSMVRGVVDPRAAERRATPWLTLRGISTQTALGGVAEGGAAREFWGQGRLFGDAPVDGGRYWFTAHRSDLGPEPLDPTVAGAQARQVFDDAVDPVRSVLADAGDDVLATRLWVTPPMRRYVRGRLVVIGDAAHASLPNLARGASDAIIDAVTLAATLNSGASLRAWEVRRVVRTQAHRVAAASVMRLATAGVLR